MLGPAIDARVAVVVAEIPWLAGSISCPQRQQVTVPVATCGASTFRVA
jgi:hypothetical protein